MKNLYVDFDGVIVNTIDITYKMITDEKIDIKDAKECLKFYQNLDWYRVLDNCKPINDSFECIEKIIKNGKFNVAILTHVNSIGEIEAKVKFLRSHLKDITIITVPKSLAKSCMLRANDAILVDDYAVNLEEWEQAGGFGVRFDLDKNGKGFPVIDRLDMLLDMKF